MTKQVVFLVCSNGIDGRGKERIEYASLDEAMRDRWQTASKNPNWNCCVTRVVDLSSHVLNFIHGLCPLSTLAMMNRHVGMEPVFIVRNSKSNEVMFASLSESERTIWINEEHYHPSHYSVFDEAHDLSKVWGSIVKQMDGLDQLAFELHQKTFLDQSPAVEPSENSLAKFMAQTRIDVEEFERKYFEKHRENPENYPLEMEEGNEGMWFEFFMIYCTTGEV
jgi:hypothetical protein